MATTVTPVSLKQRATAFSSMDNEIVQSAINEAVRWIDEAAWGVSHFDDGVFYLACHILDEDAALNSATAGSGADATPAGPLTSEKILGWSASWSSSDDFNDALATTGWGRRYIARRSLVFSARSI